MVRKLALVFALAIGFSPVLLQALGLGDVELKSYLNQPLVAEIEILSIDRSELKGIRVKLASNKEFKRNGLEYNSKLRNLSFKVIKKKGRTYIRITSRSTFKEPYLNILLDVAWSRGRIMREYALLIDPKSTVPSGKTRMATSRPPPEPVKVEPKVATPAKVEPPKEVKAAKASKNVPVKAKLAEEDPFPVREEVIKDEVVKKATRKDESPVTSAHKEFEKESNKYPRIPLVAESDRSQEVNISRRSDGSDTPSKYRVKRGDTMMDIAKRLRPSRSVSLHQTMMAIKRANPKAFIKDNIHWVRAGSRLNIPDQQSISSMTQNVALSSYRKDTDLFKSREGEVTVAKTTAKPAATANSKGKARGVFSVEAPSDQNRNSGQLGREDKKGAERGGLSAKAKAEAQAKKDFADRETLEAKTRQELMKTLETKQSLLTIKDAGLAKLQSKLKILKYCEKNVYDTNCYKVMGYTSVDIEKLRKKYENQKVEPYKEAAKTVNEGDGDFISSAQYKVSAWFGYFKKNPMMAAIVGGGTLFVLILLFLIIRQRKRANDEFQESILEFEQATSVELDAENSSSKSKTNTVSPVTNSVMPSNTAAVNTSTLGETTGDDQESSYLSDFVVSNMDGVQDVAESDPITEADVFYAYGKYEAAEMLIKEAIQTEPNRLDLRYKLLDIYHGAKNNDAFEYEASILFDMLNGRSDPMWDKVVEMGREVSPGNALFGGTSADAVPQTTEQPSVKTEVQNLADALPEDLDLEFDFDDLNAEASKVSNEAESNLGSDLETELAALEGSIDKVAAENDDMSFDIADSDLTVMSENVVSFDINESQTADTLASTDNDLDPYDSDLLMADVDEVGTKLDLAKAYIDMGDPEGARSILDEVLEEGNAQQKGEAEELMQQMAV